MLKWFNRGKKRKPQFTFGATTSDGDEINASNTMPNESTATHQQKRVIAS